MRLKRYIGLNAIVTAIFCIFVFMMLAVKNGFMLRWYDEMSLFEPTRFFFQQCVHYPGGVLRYAGAWLTQFMYHPWLGTSILIILWLLLAWLTRKAFSLPESLYPLSFIVPIALFVSVAHLDEAWVSMKSAGYLFFPTLGYIFTVVGILIYRHLSRHAVARIFWMVCLALAYFIAGFFALLSAFVCIVLDLAEGIRGRKWLQIVESPAMLVLIALIPQIYYIYYPGNTADNDYLYLKGLPDFYMEAYDAYLWIPFIVATLVIVMLVLVPSFRMECKSKSWGIISLCAIVGCGIWGVIAEKKSEQLRATVLMLQSIERGDWNRVCNTMLVIKEQPNYTMQVLSGLAATKLGEKFPDLSGYPHVNIDPRHSEDFTITAFVNVPANYYIGEFNQSYHWAMEHCVQYGKRVFFLKYMVKDALMNGETKLAKRYNDILLRTMFHRKWAEEMELYILNPSMMEQNPEFNQLMQLDGQGN